MGKEVWKDLPEYKGLYQISNCGRVKSLQRYPIVGRILKPASRGGYLRLTLSQDGRDTVVSVHRLVAEAFLEPKPDGHEVNHKNGDKADNRIENLEWITPSENTKHSYRVLGVGSKKGERNGRAKLTRDDVRKIRELYATDNYTQIELGEMFGIASTNVSFIVNRKTWTHIP